MQRTWLILGAAALSSASAAAQQAPAAQAPMSFFITSAGSGKGADLGGLEGADRHCQKLAEAAGSRGLKWHAYLSTIPKDGTGGVNARDRIGKGPWHNAKGVKIADNVADLHSDGSKLSKGNSLTEKGAMVNGRGDEPNMHDIITGTSLDGSAYAADGYTNCDNFTSSGDGSTRVGHHDRTGGGENPSSWNSAHNSRGCSQANLVGTGGNGLFYCFAS